jgi:carbonic anhydrase
MHKSNAYKKVATAAAVLVLLLAVVLAVSSRAQFIAGGVMVNLGYRLQDHIHVFDFDHDHDISPAQVWQEVSHQNELASSVRRSFPRSTHHPLVAMLVCMDARIDTLELTGDTRKYYYVIRNAGSVISEREEEMLELAVANGVKLLLLTTHSDCAAEKAAADPESRLRYPKLTAAIAEREQRINELLARPNIAEKIASGELLVKRMKIDTSTDHLEVSQR